MLSKMSPFMAPPEKSIVEEWLAELSIMVARSKQAEVDEKLRLAVYARNLSAYPADIVKHAILGVGHKFWPVWIELKDYCDNELAARNVLIDELKKIST